MKHVWYNAASILVSDSFPDDETSIKHAPRRWDTYQTRSQTMWQLSNTLPDDETTIKTRSQTMRQLSNALPVDETTIKHAPRRWDNYQTRSQTMRQLWNTLPDDETTIKHAPRRWHNFQPLKILLLLIDENFIVYVRVYTVSPANKDPFCSFIITRGSF